VVILHLVPFGKMLWLHDGAEFKTCSRKALHQSSVDLVARADSLDQLLR